MNESDNVEAAPEATAAAGTVGAAVALPTALLITDVRSFAAGLRTAVAGGDVAIDASRLKDIDTAGLQLLVAVRLDVVVAGNSFRWVGESPALRAAAAATGLSQALGLAA